nr:hypothetical protein [Tanacetum cinerariifolium]
MLQQQTKGLGEGSCAILEVFDELAFKSSNKEAGILPEVLDRLKDESSSSSSESKLAVKDISSDDEEVSQKAVKITKNTKEVAANANEVIKNTNEMTEVEKNTDAQVAEEQLLKTLTKDKGLVDTIEPTTEAQADALMFMAQPEKPKATIVNSSHTLSFAKFTNHFLNEHADVNLFEFLKDNVESKVQSMVDVLVKETTPAALRQPSIDTTVILNPDQATNPPF